MSVTTFKHLLIHWRARLNAPTRVDLARTLTQRGFTVGWWTLRRWEYGEAIPDRNDLIVARDHGQDEEVRAFAIEMLTALDQLVVANEQ